MKKIIIINGSNKGENSATLKMANAFIEGVKDEVECVVECIHLRDYHINLCTGCLSCWNDTPGKCHYEDDMAKIIKKYQSADYVVYSSCVHSYGVTALDRIFAERLLPVVETISIKNSNTDNSFSLKSNRPTNNKHIILYSCGSLNVTKMMTPIKALYANMYNNECLMLFGSRKLILEQEQHQNKFLKALVFAGQDFGKYGYITKEVQKYVDSFYKESNDLIMIDANFRQQLVMTNPMSEISHVYTQYKAYSMMDSIAQAYNPLVNQSLQGTLEFRINDIEEVYQFKISNGTCQLSVNVQEPPQTIVTLTYDVLVSLFNQRTDFVTAFSNKQFEVEGDFDYITAMNNGMLIGSLNKQKELSYFISNNGDGTWTTNKFNNFTTLLLPWILSWILYFLNLELSIVIPTLVALAIVSLKNKKDLTYLDKATLIGFIFQSLFLIMPHEDWIQTVFYSLNNFTYSFIILLTLFQKIPFSMYLTTNCYSNSFNNLKSYVSVHRLVTLLWLLFYLCTSFFGLLVVIKQINVPVSRYCIAILSALFLGVITIVIEYYGTQIILQYKNRKKYLIKK